MADTRTDDGSIHQASGLTIGDLFRQAVASHPDRIALKDRHHALTYAALADRVARLVRALASRGVAPGDRVAILSENRREYVELQLACAERGAIIACQNWRQADPELSHCLRLVTPGLVFVSERHASTLARLGLDIPTITLGPDYEALIDHAPDAAPPPLLDPEAGAVILYTSGTTGMPKGALISHRAIIARSLVARIDGGTIPGRAFIAWAPLFHMVSTDPSFATLMTGGTVITMDGLDVPELIAWISSETLNHLVLMPGMVDRVINEMNHTGTKPLGPDSIVSCGCMADLVPRHQIAEITTLLNAPFRNSFGATETGSPPAGRANVAVGDRPERLSKLQNSLCSIRLVDEDDLDVPDGEPGELLIRGPTLFSGYWAAPETNARDFRGGWFHMGDVFVRNPDRSLDFVDRRKYLIKSGGENIYPAEIENALRLSPRIFEAVVVRRPDDRWGEVPVAFVVPTAVKPGDPALTAADVLAACHGRLARYKIPKDVIFVTDADLPRSTTGKVMRHELEARLRPPAEPQLARRSVLASLAAAALLPRRARAAEPALRYGVLTDMSGVFSDGTGPGSVAAARIAIEELGGSVLGGPIDLIVADHQNKPDVGAAIARDWFDRGGVDVILDVPVSSICIAVQSIARERNKMFITSGGGSAELSGKYCNPNFIQWTYTTYALANVAGKAMLQRGGDTWFFIVADYVFGQQLERDTVAVVQAGGGRVLGRAPHPIGTTDFSAALLAAKESGAKVIALANSGQDAQTAIKQAGEFGMLGSNQKFVSLLIDVSDIRAVGLDVAHGLIATAGFYWNMDDRSRGLAARFAAKMNGRVPGMIQAGVYSSVLNYTRAVASAGTKDPAAVLKVLHAADIDDAFARHGKLRANNLVIHDMYLAQVKSPDKSTGPSDVYDILGTVSGTDAAPPLATSACPMLKA